MFEQHCSVRVKSRSNYNFTARLVRFWEQAKECKKNVEYSFPLFRWALLNRPLPWLTRSRSKKVPTWRLASVSSDQSGMHPSEFNRPPNSFPAKTTNIAGMDFILVCHNKQYGRDSYILACCLPCLRLWRMLNCLRECTPSYTDKMYDVLECNFSYLICQLSRGKPYAYWY